MRFRIPAFFLIGCSCLGQSLSIGVKGGVRATDDISGDATSESKRYTVGPMLEVGLPLSLALEFNALYRADGYRTAFSNFAGSSFARERANSWEFPIMVKYKLLLPLAKPYLAAGFAPRTIGVSVDSNNISIDLGNGKQTFSRIHTDTNWKTSHGILVGGGVQLGLGAMRLSPEVRYTYWDNNAINVFGSQGYNFHSTQSQIDLLLGISWRVR